MSEIYEHEKVCKTNEEVYQNWVNQKELKWNEKSASFYIIMYFFTYNLKYKSLPEAGSLT